MTDVLPTSGNTLGPCVFTSGTFSQTYDQNFTTGAIMQAGSCLIDWKWNAPVLLTAAKIAGLNFTKTGNSITAIYGIAQDGSYTKVWEGTWQPAESSTTYSTKAVTPMENCYGLILQIMNQNTTYPVKIFEVRGSTITISATWYACTGTPGANVTANFQWTGATEYCTPYCHYAEGWMVAPNGSTCDGPYSWTSQTSGPNIFVTCVGSQAGTYTAHLKVFTTASGDYIEKTITCVVGTGNLLTVTINPSAAQQAGCWVQIEGCSSYSCYYPAGTVVDLNAVPLSGWLWSSWTGTNNNTIDPTTVTMNSNKSVTCNFTASPLTYTTVPYLYDDEPCDETAPPATNWFSPGETVGAWLRLDWPGHSWSGQELRWKWYHNDGLIWEDYTTLGNWYDWIYWCLDMMYLDAGDGYVQWYLDGTYICQTIYHVTYAGTVAFLLHEDCDFNAGPYNQNQQDVQIATLRIHNEGDTTGSLQWRCYAYPNNVGGTEVLLAEGQANNVPSQGNAWADVIVDIPNDSGTIKFGVKVKGSSEAWPTWSGLNLSSFIWGGD